jgi:phenylalanyl-tRNA synthetase beta chain
MRLPLDWLAEWIDLPPVGELVERLNLGGFEDAEVHDTGPDLSAIRVGRVVERAAHPNADRLSVCRVDVGEAETLEVVCGAPNVAAGQKVAIAVSGTKLPDGKKLKRSKIRGVVSQGMICSSQELGLGDEHEGILVLDPEAALGAPLSEVIATPGRVLEFGLTPNRGDVASLLGVAREVRAFFGGSLRMPETAPPEAGSPAAEAIAVYIDAPEACHRYHARVVRGLRVAPSPEALCQRFEACGFRPINSVVDVTNLVLLEFGQPLHAFDLARVQGGEVRVRFARRGEKLTTLDGECRELHAEDLVIADAERPIALAGVMGGADTEVTDSTTDVLIESAHFHPTIVRLGARRHGLHSEASYRFERGVDREGIGRAADRAARLILEVAGGEVARASVEAVGHPPQTTAEIRLAVERANRLLGTSLSTRTVIDLLGRVGVACREQKSDVVVGRVPSHRNDLQVHQDLTEEVARIYGYERIPTTQPVAVLEPVALPASWVMAERSRDALAGAGLTETVSFPFIGVGELEALQLEPGDPRKQTLRVSNPIKEEEPLLRSSLLPSLLRVARQNLSRQAERVRIFEVSRVFLSQGDGELPREPLQAAALIAEPERSGLWEAAGGPALFFRAKGIAENLLNQLGYVASLDRGPAPPQLHPGAAVAIEVGGTVIGAVGELHPDVAAGFDIEAPCAVLEIDLGSLLSCARREPRYREVSRFPQVRRDIAVILERAQPAGEVLEAVRRSAGRDLASAELFDVYEGSGVPEGRVSLAFRLLFQRPDRTLRDAEVTAAIDRVVGMLSDRFGGELR